MCRKCTSILRPNCQRARRDALAIPLDRKGNIAVLEVIIGVLRIAEPVDPGPPDQAAAAYALIMFFGDGSQSRNRSGARPEEAQRGARASSQRFNWSSLCS